MGFNFETIMQVAETVLERIRDEAHDLPGA